MKLLICILTVLLIICGVSAVTWWGVRLTQQVAHLEANVPADQTFEIDELRRKMADLEERLGEAQSAADAAMAEAEDARLEAEELRNDLIAVTVAMR